jgi:hypothetical protein
MPALPRGTRRSSEPTESTVTTRWPTSNSGGCDVVTVQRAPGHAGATTTLKTYSHLWPTAEDRTRRAAAELFADSCGLGAHLAPQWDADLRTCRQSHVEAKRSKRG